VKLAGNAADPVRGHGLNFTVSVDGQDLGTLGALVGAPLPAKPYHLAATISGDADKTITLKGLQASLGASSINGDASLTLAGARPKLSGHFTAPMLDLTEFPQAKAPPPSPARSADADRMFSSAPLPLDGLRAADADIALNAATIKTSSMTLQNLALHLSLVDQVLQVKPISVTLSGGTLDAAVDLSARQAPATLSLQADGKQIDVGKLVQQASGNDLLDAKGDLDLAVHGSGDSLHAIMASLDGRYSLVIGKGTIKSRYADLIGADVFREAFAWAKGKHDTALNCVVSRFDIKNGLATATGLLMDTSEVSMQGEGTVNLGSERLDLTLKPRPKETSLLSLATPIDVTGTLKHPSVLPDKAALAKEVAVGVATTINPLVAVGSFVLNNTGGSDKNPCVAALEAKGGSAAAAPKQDRGVVGGTVNSIKNLFK
ncbi:MAG TPA: AsmA-like C-terminal region-containing protein, partial [Candidatus Sulfotelmatobacter sp.]|nr:AsmA-like C-terminal region-containing protein [Candidatus Sulfotelmatobacter sp.]